MLGLRAAIVARHYDPALSGADPDIVYAADVPPTTDAH